jgi:hypothetical protein
MAVMSSDDVVGRHQSIPETRRKDVKDQPDNAGGQPRASRPPQQHMCGAMAQQGDDYHTLSQPQEFVRLVGYRDPRVKPPRAPS